MTEAYNPSGKKVAVLLLIACVIATALQHWKITEHLDWVLYDLQMPLWSSTAPEDVVIIAIDDKSIEKLGRWPWSRSIHARLINQLTEYKTGPIIFNVLFSV